MSSEAGVEMNPDAVVDNAEALKAAAAGGGGAAEEETQENGAGYSFGKLFKLFKLQSSECFFCEFNITTIYHISGNFLYNTTFTTEIFILHLKRMGKNYL